MVLAWRPQSKSCTNCLATCSHNLTPVARKLTKKRFQNITPTPRHTGLQLLFTNHFMYTTFISALTCQLTICCFFFFLL